MGGNSFATHDGAHVSGAVAMALDEQGRAVPVTEDTPIGRVRVEGIDLICRALAAHAAFISGKPVDKAYRAISEFVNANPVGD